MMRGEKVTKAWKVVGRDANGHLVQISRRYHAKSAADVAADLAIKSGYTDVEVRTIQGRDKIET